MEKDYILTQEGKAKLAEFEAGQAQIDAGYATLLENPDVKAKVDAGMDKIAAGREALAEATVETTKMIVDRVIVYGAFILAALIGLIAAILGFGAAKMPSIGKIKGGILLGLISLVLAVGSNGYGIYTSYQEFVMPMVAAIAVCVFALLFVVAIFRYKNALVALMTAE